MLKNALKITRQESATALPRLARNAARYGINKYLLHSRFAVQAIHGSAMKLDLHDPGISRALFILQDREREHLYLLKKIIKPNQTILDLGANIGYYVLLESKLLNNTGRIIAVEPSPENFELLTENVRLNKLNNVELVHGAIAEQDGTVDLHLSQLSNVHSLLPNHSKSTGKTTSVPSYTIESIPRKHGPIDLIRMDIEGYEQVILDTLISPPDRRKPEGGRPTILFELHPKTYNRKKFAETIKRFYDANYTVPYLASSDQSALTQAKVPIETSIATDGRLRHIGVNLSLDQVLSVVWNARCMVLAPRA